MNINLRDLQYFVTVAEQRHFGRAAQLLNVTQPTLSMQLRKLEERLGGKLIERLPRDAIPTALGREALPLARELLRVASELESRCLSKDKRGTLRLGVIPTIAPYLLPKISRSLSQRIERRKVSLMEAQTAELVRSVKDGSIDVAIVSTPLNDRGLEEISLYCEPFYLAVSSSHPLARRKKVSLQDLQGEKLLLLGEGHCMRNQALSLCKFSQASDDADLSATSIETLRSMVAMGAGITLIPKLATLRSNNVSYVHFADNSVQRTVGLIYRRSFAEMKLIDALIGIIKDAAEKEALQLLNR